MDVDSRQGDPLPAAVTLRQSPPGIPKLSPKSGAALIPSARSTQAPSTSSVATAGTAATKVDTAQRAGRSSGGRAGKSEATSAHADSPALRLPIPGSPSSPEDGRSDDSRQPQLVERPPRTLDGCAGSCTLPREQFRTALSEFTELITRPIPPLAGPLMMADAPRPGGEDRLRERVRAVAPSLRGAHDHHGGARAASSASPAPSSALSADPDRLERLWELRLCIEQLHASLEDVSQGIGGEWDTMFTADEALSSIEETLHRVAVLGIMASQRPRFMAHQVRGDWHGPGPPLWRGGAASASAATPGGAQVRAPSWEIASPNDPRDVQVLLQAIVTLSSRRGALTQRLLDSGLGISGLLEAVLGELTAWQSLPSDVDLQTWRRWDQTFAQLARRAGIVSAAPPWDAFAEKCCHTIFCVPFEEPTMVQVSDARPHVCAPRCVPLWT